MQPISCCPFRRSAIALAGATLFAACGGGGGDDGAPPAAPTQLVGVAATGTPLAGASIRVVDSDAATTDPAPVTAGGDGRYTVDVSGLKTPLILQAEGNVEGAPVRLFAVVPALAANADNTANTTSLTHAVAALVAPGGDPAALLVPSVLASSATVQNVSNASALVVNTLATDPAIAAALGTGFDPLTTSFSADGTGIDGVLDQLAVEVSSSGVSIANLSAPLGSDAVPQPVVLTAAQTATPTAVPTLPASAVAGAVPTEAELAALGAKYEACLALPTAQRVTRDAEGTVTALSPTCDYASADYRSDGRSWIEGLGQFILTKDFMTGAKVGNGTVVLTQAATNLTDPKTYKHPYCNSATCVVVRYPLTHASGQVSSGDWVLAKVEGAWNFVGNQRPYRVFVEPRLNRKQQVFRNGTAPYFHQDRYESVLRLIFDLSVGDTSHVRAVRFRGPGLPAAGVVQYRSQRCGASDRMGIVNQQGSTRLNTDPSQFQFWTGGATSDFVLDAANFDGTPLAMPVPVRNMTTQASQEFSPVAVPNQSTAIPAWSLYTVEIFRMDALSDEPDEIVPLRIVSAAENAAQGPTKPWPTLAQADIDAYLTPGGAKAGALSSFAEALNWSAAAGTYVQSGYLFAQNFATVSNSQNETASYGLRTRLDFEPAAFGDTSAQGWRFAPEIASGTSLNSFTATVSTNPNPRCTSSDVVPLTSDVNDYREVGLAFRGNDRKLYNAQWIWDN